MPDLQEQKLQAEIDKIKAEVTKLETETASLKRPFILKPGSWIPLLAGIAALVGSLTQWAKTAEELKAAEAKKSEVVSYNAGLTNQLEQQDKERELNKAETAQQITKLIEEKLAQLPKSKQLDKAAISALGQQAAQAIAKPEVQYVSLPRKVVIQYRDDKLRELSAKLQQVFNSQGIPSPPPEQVNINFRNSVRFAYNSDKANAEKIADITQKFLQEQNCPLKLDLQYHPESQTTQKPGAIEVWIDPICK